MKGSWDEPVAKMYCRTITVATLLAMLLLLAACDDAPPSPYTGYLTEEIPPCTPVTGSSIDPCEPDAEQYAVAAGGTGFSPDFGDGPRTMRELLDFPGGAISHLVLRGTYLPNTVRCTAGNPFRPPSYLSHDEYDFVEHALSIDCYVDVRVGAYILGDGPSILTVQRFFYTYWAGGFALIAEGEGQTEEEYIEDLRQLLETNDYLGGIAGREVVLFLGPAASAETEVWEVFQIWDIQQRDDGTVIAVHPDRDIWRHYEPDLYQTFRSEMEMELPALTQAVTSANQARVSEYGGRIGVDASLPLLVTDANQLRQYYTSTGAYDHPDGTPVPPPPVPGEGDPVPTIRADDSTPESTPPVPGG